MPKNFSVVMNIVLTIAVAVLFYLHFSSSTADGIDTSPSDTIPSEVKKPIVPSANEVKNTTLAFVNSDSIFSNYDFYNKVKKETESKMAALENNYKVAGMKFQDDYNDYIEKAGKGAYTKEQALKIEADLTARKQKIDAMEMQVGTLQETADKQMADVQGSLSTFFNQYAIDHHITCIITYNDRGEGALGVDRKFDITNDAITGLNSAYQVKLEMEKKAAKK